MFSCVMTSADVQSTGLKDLININSRLNFIIGGINSGKSTWCKILISLLNYKKLYLIIRDFEEWKDTKFDTSTKLSTDTFFANIENLDQLETNSLIILDDFFFIGTSKDNFYKFVNFYISHKNLTVFICIHHIYKNNLYNTILSNSSFFLTYSTINNTVLKVIDSKFNTKYTELYNHYLNLNYSNLYNIFYLNLEKNICIPAVNTLFIKSKEKLPKIDMFKNNTKYLILPENKIDIYLPKASKKTKIENERNIEDFKLLDSFLEIIKTLYPKSKKIHILSKQLYTIFQNNKNITSNYDIIIDQKNVGNLLDFITCTQNPNMKSIFSPKTIKVLKYLKNKHIKFPIIFIKNKNIYKYICH